METNVQTYGLVKVCGPDAKKFLQGQLTCNMDHVNTCELRLAALCNPQGRIISLFHIKLIDTCYYLIMDQSLINPTLLALKKYAVFYKLTLEDASRELPTQQAHLPNLEKLKKTLFDTGIPTLYESTSTKFLPHEINLHLHGAIDFDKGCYTGQEIIARMHYKGKVKSQLYHANITTQHTPVPGALIDSLNGICGTIVDVMPGNSSMEFALLILCDNSRIDTQLFIQNHPHDYIIVNK